MIDAFRFFRAWSTRSQIWALLVATQLLAVMVSAAAITRLGTREPPAPTAIAEDVAGPLTMFLRVVDRLGGNDRAATAATAAQSDSRLKLVDGPVPTIAEIELGIDAVAILAAVRNGAPAAWRDKVSIGLRKDLDDAWDKRENEKYFIAISLEGGRTLVYNPRSEGVRRALPPILLTQLILFILLPMIGAGWWVSSTLVAPLARLADATTKFSDDLDATPIVEAGPPEIRRVARSFNIMRAQIKKSVEARTAMLAAISHDLRTPLTRMRLRVERLGDERERNALLNDVVAMQSMTDSALSHLRDIHSKANLEPVDIAALSQTICDEFADAGREVMYRGPDRLVARCDALSLRRALTNLVDNAVTYAGDTIVRLEPLGAREVLLRIEDHGPGIAEADREALMTPFRRGDAARGGRGGFGLGLSIARDIIERHGGAVTLGANQPNGLIVSIVLPTLAAPAAKT